MFEITCDDIDESLVCGEKAVILIVVEGGGIDDSPWFVTAYCDEHAKGSAAQAEKYLPGDYVIVTLGEGES